MYNLTVSLHEPATPCDDVSLQFLMAWKCVLEIKITLKLLYLFVSNNTKLFNGFCYSWSVVVLWVPWTGPAQPTTAIRNATFKVHGLALKIVMRLA
jgi:hypothetical protein